MLTNLNLDKIKKLKNKLKCKHAFDLEFILIYENIFLSKLADSSGNSNC